MDPGLQRYFREKIVRVERLYDALSNSVFLVETEEAKFVVKERGPGPELAICAALGLPRVLSVHDDLFVLEYIEHRKVDFERDWKKVATGLRGFHGTRVSFALGDQGALLRTFCGDGTVTPILRRLLSTTESVLGSPGDLPGHYGLCHNDPQPGNILIAGEAAVFIDFEYASLGNQLADIAGLFCEVMCDYGRSRVEPGRAWPRERKRAFLRAYLGDEDADCDALLAQVTRLETFSHLLWFLWGRECLRRGRRKTGNFDYHAYTESRMGFLRSLVSEDEFCALERDLGRLLTAPVHKY